MTARRFFFGLRRSRFSRLQEVLILGDAIHHRPLPSDLPRPKFWFGQQVCWQTESNISRDSGEVIGLVFRPFDYGEGWVYWVQQSSPDPKLPLIQWVVEEELLGREKAPKM